MADNSRKTPIQVGLNNFGSQKTEDAVKILGKSLPVTVTEIVSSGIIKIKFEVNSPYTLPEVTVPVAESEWIRHPIQKGDKGIVCPLDVYQGGVSGLGGGTADLSQRANLSTHRFIPVGNTAWSKVDNDAVNINGPNGAVIRDNKDKSTITLTPKKLEVTITDGTITIKSNGAITIQSDGEVTIKGSKINLN